MRIIAVGLNDLLAIEQIVMGCVTTVVEFINRENQIVMMFPSRKEGDGSMIKIGTTEKVISTGDPYLVQILSVPSEFKYYEWVMIISIRIATTLALHGWIFESIKNYHGKDNTDEIVQKGPFTVTFRKRL
jgi:hypothetical protein